MKKVLVILGFAVFTLGIAIEESSATTTKVAVYQGDGKRMKIAVDSLPPAVLKAWKASPNASATVSEVTKVTNGTAVIFEVSYSDAKGVASVSKFNADGTSIK